MVTRVSVSPRSRYARRVVTALLSCGVVGPALFCVTVIVAGALRPSYSSWRDAASLLALGPGGWVQTVNFVVGGVLVLGHGIGLRGALRDGPGSTWAPRLVGGIGLALLILAFFPIAPGIDYPPAGWAPPRSGAGFVHGVVGTILFGMLSAACFVLARRFRDDRAWHRYSIATGWVVAVAYLITIVLSSMSQYGSWANAPAGLLERLALFPGFLWLVLVAIRALRRA